MKAMAMNNQTSHSVSKAPNRGKPASQLNIKTSIKIVGAVLLIGCAAGVNAQQLRAATICCGAATLDNGSIVTIGQPFVGLTTASDASVSANVGMIPVLAQLSGPSCPPRLYPSLRLVNGKFQMAFCSQTGRAYEIQASTNLVTWNPVWTNIGVGASVVFEDALATNFVRRFYRVLVR